MNHAGLRVLIVEDESLVALEAEMGLEQLGYEVLGVAVDVQAALEAAIDGQCDVVVLDLSLDGCRADPIADALDRSAIPFIVASGTPIDDSMPRAVRCAPRVPKPYGAEDLHRAIVALIEAEPATARSAAR